jgi:hypothetical protein
LGSIREGGFFFPFYLPWVFL